jgi:L-lactate dehydrogenase complex protein LldG
VNARDEILGRVRAALVDAPGPPEVPRGYRGLDRAGGGLDELNHPEVLEVFAERVADYKADVVRCSAADVEPRISEALAGARTVVPPELEWRVPDAVVDTGLTAQELDGIEAVVTAAAVGIAETGTVVLDHGRGQGRRALSLVPDLHVLVVRADQVVSGVPEAVARLDPARPTTWISGPSATSDIELNRVEGVHGPRRLVVLLVG